MISLILWITLIICLVQMACFCGVLAFYFIRLIFIFPQIVREIKSTDRETLVTYARFITQRGLLIVFGFTTVLCAFKYLYALLIG